MAQFDKSQFTPGIYVTYGPDRKFIARFKYARRDRAGFIAFLVKNFTTEEYFAMLDAKVTPLAALESKGYVGLTVRRILKDAGFPETQEGFRAYVKARAKPTVDGFAPSVA